ncbi:conserved hypothetical protein [Leishmania major strain Friedlin]|uniref:HORMA domain-containing protein n=1 Tax=Leishmania major TaxID=5664 RepID=Q4Q1W5_LEIMA|nr:conserved hypothetical protein [Leishmania major strain Friedlin]CAG9583629.1 HORMA_domain_containing_protein_-_putative [Leishmania major strain Friedlin]CAJ09064.1 conserved hypothetical protein [Leishmania major strain Friedlin]|eukprot:XP_001686683.1 conserved hypothetical protein [Leishmania major strain Friedlin]
MTSTVTAVNQTQSLAAIRNFVRASVSCITYARGLCSDNAYEQRPFLGLPLRQLIPSTTESITISEWIEKGAFDALNRNYLKEMSLCVYDAACHELLESYCFGFNYTGDGERAQMTLNASQTIADGSKTTAVSQSSGGAVGIPAYRKRRCTKQEVQHLLTSILERLMDVVESLPPLLSERVLTMRLTYYDAVTPASYEPPCFAPASEHMARLYQAEVKHHVNIGSMDTSHHLFSVAIRHPLLQQIHRQMTGRTTSAVATKTGGSPLSAGKIAAVSTPSDPLRSGWESSFSSDPAVASAVAAAGATVTHGVVASHASCGLLLCADGEGAAFDAENAGEEKAAGSSLGEVGGGGACTARTGETLRPCEVAKLDGVYRLMEKSTSGDERRLLRPAELTYLLFAAFVFTKAPSARGGRGELKADEVEAYRALRCPFDVSAKTVLLVLQRLSREDFLQPCNARGAPAPKMPKAEEGSRPTPAIRAWLVPDPPASLLQQLMQVDAVTELLTHESHLVLQELSVYLAREEWRRAPRTMTAKATSGRISTTGGSGKRRSSR